jgi:hypothetical protein
MVINSTNLPTAGMLRILVNLHVGRDDISPKTTSLLYSSHVYKTACNSSAWGKDK